MPVRTNLTPNERMNEWLNSQIDDLQHYFHLVTLPIFNALNQFLILLSYLNPFTYILIFANFIHRLVVSPHTHRSILGSIILGFIFVISFLFSIIAYIAFYRTYVPHVGFSLPVWLQYGQNRVPHAVVDLITLAPDITVDQAYDVHVHLTVPTNNRNMNMGNFMVNLDIITAPPHNVTLHHSSRPASLAYEPGFARVLHAFKYLRILFFFSSPASVQYIKVPLLEHRVINPSSLGKRVRISHARIDVGRMDVYSSPNLLLQQHGWGELQIYKASLVFDAHLDGLRWMLYYHSYASFFLFSAFFFIAELATVLCTWAVVLQGKPPPNSHESDSFPKEESPFDVPPNLMYEDDPSKPGVSHLGTTEIDSSSNSENEPRSLGDSDGQENDPLFDSSSKIKAEVNDDGVLVGSSNPTDSGGSISTVFGSLRSRRSQKVFENS